jgi:hypothetical protein
MNTENHDKNPNNGPTEAAIAVAGTAAACCAAVICPVALACGTLALVLAAVGTSLDDD